MKKVYFATTNEGKLKEAREILGLEVVGTPQEVDEIQSLDPIKVTLEKTLPQDRCYPRQKKELPREL